MLWIIVIAIIIIIIGFFVLNGIKSRCPNCGFYGLNPIDKKRETEKKEYYENRSSWRKNLDRKGIAVTEKPGYANRNLKCKKCGHRFTRKTSTIWLKIENQLGKEAALQEYQKVEGEDFLGDVSE